VIAAPDENLTCLNCGTPLEGRYCHACGQKAASLHLGVHDFVHEATHEFLHLDGKILSTVKLLVTRPGQLTKEFIEGRRARYITPLRLYLTFSVLFFALAVLAPRELSIVQAGTGRPGTKATTEEYRQADELGRAIMHNLPHVMFVLMPVFALLTLAFYRRAMPYYVPHLYYAVHFHAFVFLTLSITALLTLISATGKIIGTALFLVAFPYHYLALHRFFGDSWPRTLMKGTAIGVIYLLVMAGAMIALVLTIIKH